MSDYDDDFDDEYDNDTPPWLDDEDFQCPTCRGRGVVNPLTAPNGFFCVSSTDCPMCDGSGRI